jgi:putative aminopeptidase FrvX
MDSIGFTVRYGNELVKIGSPVCEDGFKLTGKDSKGEIECTLRTGKNRLSCDYLRTIDPGTTLTFLPEFHETDDAVQCCYLDNRLGVYNCLRLMETLEDGLIIFSSGEEHGGGSVGFLTGFMVNEYNVRQALISDITWVTEGVKPGKGAAISIRDSGIPRKSYINKIIGLANDSGIPFQLEVEGAGGSDGSEIQHSPYAVDWCFIGAPEMNVHSPTETVHKADIESMLALYRVLMKSL